MPLKYNISISLIASAYNEEESIEWAARKWVKDLSGIVADYEIILVDDGSTDKTWEIVAAMQEEFPKIRSIKLEKNHGIGAATMIGVYASEKDFIFWDPVDMPFDTKNLPVLLDKINKSNIVIGYRSDRRHNSLFRKITSYTNYWLIRILSGMSIKDFQHIQIYPRKLFDEISVVSRSTFIPPEVIIKAHKAGYTYAQVEMDYSGRKRGKSKCASTKVILRSVYEIFRFFFWDNLKR